MLSVRERNVRIHRDLEFDSDDKCRQLKLQTAFGILPVSVKPVKKAKKTGATKGAVAGPVGATAA